MIVKISDRLETEEMVKYGKKIVKLVNESKKNHKFIED